MSWRFSFRLLFLFATAPWMQLSAQERSPCPPQAALISVGQAAYADALALKNGLESQGMVVNCIFETKFSSAFLVWENGVPHSTLEGEACIRTNLGDLEVFFVPRPRTFADLKIKQRRVRGEYVYTVSGMSDIWPRKIERWGAAQRNYFFVHDNYLLSAGGEDLRKAVETALHFPPLDL